MSDPFSKRPTPSDPATRRPPRPHGSPYASPDGDPSGARSRAAALLERAARDVARSSRRKGDAQTSYGIVPGRRYREEIALPQEFDDEATAPALPSNVASATPRARAVFASTLPPAPPPDVELEEATLILHQVRATESLEKQAPGAGVKPSGRRGARSSAIVVLVVMAIVALAFVARARMGMP